MSRSAGEFHCWGSLLEPQAILRGFRGLPRLHQQTQGTQLDPISQACFPHQLAARGQERAWHHLSVESPSSLSRKLYLSRLRLCQESGWQAGKEGARPALQEEWEGRPQAPRDKSVPAKESLWTQKTQRAGLAEHLRTAAGKLWNPSFPRCHSSAAPPAQV